MNYSGFGNIGVIAGGPSSEREISLCSGSAVYEALKQKGCNVRIFDITDNPDKSFKGIEIDMAFITLHGGFGEDGTVQRILETMNISYTGSGPDASRLALDKLLSKKIFEEQDIPVPKYIALRDRTSVSDKCGDIAMPFVVKPLREGSSIGLSVVREKKYFDTALAEAFKYSSTVIVEEFIAGRELTVGILDDMPLPVIEIVAKNGIYDYGAKYHDDETSYVVPAVIETFQFQRAQELAVKAHRSLGCRDFSRVDMRMNEKGEIFVLEVNTIPGLMERSLLPKAAQAIGLSFGDLCIKLLVLAAKRCGRGLNIK